MFFEYSFLALHYPDGDAADSCLILVFAFLSALHKV
jgi:hypothetical protein